ncbi:tRNA-dihydrouridine synthase, partial [bacterium]|nr:tRNA-dihydrouridine synthase [bacterium]
LINTLVGMSIDIHSRRPRLATITGGYSGPTIKPVAVAKVYEVSKAVKLPIIGIGGISSPADALEFLIAGATAIQVGTANFVNPQAAVQIIAGLSDYCQQHKFNEIKALIGSLQSH